MLDFKDGIQFCSNKEEFEKAAEQMKYVVENTKRRSAVMSDIKIEEKEIDQVAIDIRRFGTKTLSNGTSYILNPKGWRKIKPAPTTPKNNK